MNYFGKLFLKTNTVGYGCLVLLGSVSVAGVAELEIQKQLWSGWGKSIGSWFSDRLQSVSPSPPPQPDQMITFSHISYPFTYVWGQVYPTVTSAWPYVQAGFTHIKSSIKSIDQIWDGLKRFWKSLFDPKIFKEIFKDWHKKIWRVLSFASAKGEGRSSFAKLFQQEKRKTTETVIKFLLGMEHKGSKYFKSGPNVFNYLLSRWMSDPERITGKFDRLSQTIDRLMDKAEKQGNGSRGPSSGSENQLHTYQLKVETVKQYLDVEEGIPEILFNMIWTGEVASTIKFGQDLTVESKSWLSWFFNSSPNK